MFAIRYLLWYYHNTWETKCVEGGDARYEDSSWSSNADCFGEGQRWVSWAPEWLKPQVASWFRKYIALSYFI